MPKCGLTGYLWQDGKDITISERLLAQKSCPEIENRLRTEKTRDGGDPLLDVEAKGKADEGIEETGTVDADGILKRPWCPETRNLEHREAV